VFEEFGGLFFFGDGAGGFVLVVWGLGFFERLDGDVRVRAQALEVFGFGFLEVRLFGFADLEDDDFHLDFTLLVFATPFNRIQLPASRENHCLNV